MRVGCDIVCLSRFKKTLERTPDVREKIFLKEESGGRAIERLAGIFAVKEAVMKATGMHAGMWHDIRVVYNTDGAPRVTFSPAYKNVSCEISIAHDGDYAFAVAICKI